MKILVIGAGPSGLVALKTLREHGYDASAVEASDKIGGTFRWKSYDDGRLVSSKYLTTFSDFRMKSADPDHPTMAGYVKYLEEYCEHFHLMKHIRFETSVEKVIRNEIGSYVVSLKTVDGTELREMYDAVAVCSGLHNVPFIPHIENLEKFSGTVLHSSVYKDKAVFRDKSVLVIGCGETGLDLSYRAIQVTKSVILAARSGFLSVPYVIKSGVPLDTFITNLFESSHLHPILERYKIKWKFSTPFIRLAFLLGTGTSTGYNQWAGNKNSSLVRRGWLIINKSTDAMPFINRTQKQRSFLGKFLYSYLDSVDDKLQDREIVVKKGVKRIVHENIVEFTDGTQKAIDYIVFATGYKVSFPFLERRKDAGQFQDELPNEHNICSSNEPTLAFFGFIRPNVGAIPPMSELQVFWWIQKLKGQVQKRKYVSYKLLGPAGRTSDYGVDYGAYMHDLAREIGANPSISRLIFESPKSLIAWALGQAYVTFFRLIGPFKTENARVISEAELFYPVMNRPIVSNIIFVSVILIFLLLNASLYILTPVLRLFRIPVDLD